MVDRTTRLEVHDYTIQLPALVLRQGLSHGCSGLRLVCRLNYVVLVEEPVSVVAWVII